MLKNRLNTNSIKNKTEYQEDESNEETITINFFNKYELSSSISMYNRSYYGTT